MGNKRRIDRELIVAAAVALVEEHGVDNINLNQLATKLGVKPPSLYNHIDGVHALIVELATLSMRKLGDAIRDAAVGKTQDEALMAMALAYRTYAKENPGLYKAMVKVHPDESNELQAANAAIIRTLYQVTEAYHCSEEEVHHFAIGIHSMLHGFVSLEEAGFFSVAVDADDSYSKLVGNLISVIQAQAHA